MRGPHHHVLQVVHRVLAQGGQSLPTGPAEAAVHCRIGVYLRPEFLGLPKIPPRAAARSNPQPDWPAAARPPPGVLNSLINPLLSVAVRIVFRT